MPSISATTNPLSLALPLLLLLDACSGCTYIPVNPLDHSNDNNAATLGVPNNFNPTGVGDKAGYAPDSERTRVWDGGFVSRVGLGACNQYAWKEMAIVVRRDESRGG